MRSAGLALGGTVAAGLVLATLALAQPHAKPGRPAVPGAKPKASASGGGDNPYDSSGAAAAAASGSASAAVAAPPLSDAGVVPPPPAVTGSGALSPLNPAPNEFSDGGGPAMTVDYDRLLADVASLRARVAAVSDTLFKSKIAISLETSGDHGRIAALSISLDDGIVWTSPPSFRASDETMVYEHSLAPGHHAVTVDIERHDDRDDTYRSTQRSRFIVDVPTDERLQVAFKLWDDSSIGGDFRSDQKGDYDLRVRMKARAQAQGK